MPYTLVGGGVSGVYGARMMRLVMMSLHRMTVRVQMVIRRKLPLIRREGWTLMMMLGSFVLIRGQREIKSRYAT